MFCIHCGHQVEETVQFCSNCGKSTSDSTLVSNQGVGAPPPQSAVQSVSLWNKTIPVTNWCFMVISLLLVFVLDLGIAITSPDLRSFWYMMLLVMTVFVIFFTLENYVFRKKFIGTVSVHDKGIYTMIIIRNIIFVLNFIPLIQLLGLAAIAFVGWIVLIAYVYFMVQRSSPPQK